MKTFNTHSKRLLIGLMLALVMLGGCENFMTNDKDFKSALKQEVAVANAEKVDVRVQASGNTGITTPNGSTTVKVGVAFSVLVNVNAEWGFDHWAAFNESNLTTELTDVVSFENPKAPETQATLNRAVGGILIRPVCNKRPTITQTKPTAGASDVVRNLPIKIYFDKPINKSSFTYSDGTLRQNKKFKNISITGIWGDPDTAKVEDKEDYYLDPVMSESGNSLTIKTNPAVKLPSYTFLTVIISKDITDGNNLTMANDYKLTYTLGQKFDDKPPAISAIKVRRDDDKKIYFADLSANDTHRVNGDNIYISITASDEATGGGTVQYFKVTESRISDALGNVIPETNQGTVTNEFAFDQTSTDTCEMVYQPKTTGDGVIRLAIQVTDSNGNTTALADAIASSSYYIVRDTTAPDISNAAMVAFTGSTASGFFNGLSNNKIIFTPSSTIVDYGVNGTTDVTRTRSNDVYWSFRLGDTGTFNEPSLVTSSPTLTLTGVSDGKVPVYVKFMDDLGNTSTIGSISNVNLDTTPATGKVTISDTIMANGTRMLSSNAFKVTVLGADTVTGGNFSSGLNSFYVSNASTPPAANASGWLAYADNATATCTVPATDGSHSVYVWFKDKAENVSAVATDAAFLDNTDPVITSFYLSAAAPLASATDPGNQYQNDKTNYYFAFKVIEEGSGLNSFAYSDGVQGDAPSWFNLTGNQTIGPYTVSNVNSVMTSTGVYLVTGKLTTDTTNGARNINLKVADKVGRISPTLTNQNRVIFDNVAPVVSSVSLKAKTAGTDYYESSGSVYVKDPGQVLMFTANDPKTLDTIVSGLYDFTVTSTTGALATGASGILSTSAESLISYTSPITGVPIVFEGTNGAKVVIVTVRDHALNVSLPASLTTYLDNVPPVFSLGLSFNGTTFLTKPAGTLSAFAPASPENKGNIPVTALVTATDPSASDGTAGSGVSATAGIATLTRGNTTIVSSPISSGSNWTPLIPGTVELGHPLSGNYKVTVVMKDNVGNASTEQSAGFFYDITNPVITGTPMVVANADSTNPASTKPAGMEKDGVLYANTNQIWLRTEATDFTNDPEAAGIVSANISYNVDGGDFSTPGASASDSPTAGNVIYIGNGGNGPTSNAFTIAANKTYTLKSVVTDGVGNSATSSSVVVVQLDETPPSATPVVSMDSTPLDAVKHDGNWFGKAPALTFTPADNAGGSGVKAWLLSTSNTLDRTTLNDTPALGTTWTVTTKGWHSCSSSTVDATAEFRALLPLNTPTRVYLYLVDYVGNISLPIILDSTYSFVWDTTPPAVSAFTVERTDAITVGGNAYTTGTTGSKVLLTVTAADSGVGIQTLSFSGIASIESVTAATPASHEPTISGTTVTFLNSSKSPFGPSATFYVTAILASPAVDGNKPLGVFPVDYLNNTGATVSTTIMLDNTPPAFTGTSTQLLTDYVGADTTFYVNNNVTTSFAATDAMAGMLKYLISIDLTPPAPNAWGGTAYADQVGTPVSGYLAVGEARKVFAHVMDKAGKINTLELTQAHTVTLDPTAPVISGNTFTITDSAKNRTDYTTGLVKLSVPVTETGSGVKTVTVRGTGLASVASATVNGVAASVTGTGPYIITLANPLTASTLEITGVTVVTTSDDIRPLNVVLTDAVGNVSALATQSITVDRTDPVVNTFTISRNDGITLNSGSGVNAYTTRRDVTLNVSVTETGIGIQTLNFAGVASLDSVSGAPNATISGSTISFPDANLLRGTTVSFTVQATLPETDGNKPLSLAPVDFLGHTGAAANNSIMFDGSAPVIPSVTKVTDYQGASGAFFVNVSANVSFSATDAQASPYQYLISNDGTLIASTPAAIIAANSFTGSVAYVDRSGMDVHAYFSAVGAKQLYLYVMNKAGMISVAELTKARPVILDTVSPDAGPGACTLYSSTSGLATYTTTQDVYMVIPYTESISGAKTFTFSGDVLDISSAKVLGGALSGISPTGTSLSPTPVGMTITLDSALTTGTVTITGIKLTAGKNSKTVNVTIGDAVGNNSGVAGTAATIFDDTPPEFVGAGTQLLTDFVGADGTFYVNNDVTAGFVATDTPAGMGKFLLSTSTPPSANLPGSVAYAAQSHTPVSYLLSESGARHVYAHVMDNAGNINTLELTSLSHPVTLDATAPVITGNVFTIYDSVKTTRSDYTTGSVSLSVPVTETGSGVKTITVSGTGLASVASPKVNGVAASVSGAGPYVITLSSPVKATTFAITGVTVITTSDDVRQLDVVLTDAVGNVSATATSSITVDTTKPVVNSFTISRNDNITMDSGSGVNAYTTIPTVTLNVTVTETGIGIEKLNFTGVASLGTISGITNGTVSGSTITFPPSNLLRGSSVTFSVQATLTAGDGNKSLSLTPVDFLSNTGTAATKTIIFDSTAPLISSITNVSEYKGSLGAYFVNASASIGFTATDSDSAPYKYLISNDVTLADIGNVVSTANSFGGADYSGVVSNLDVHSQFNDTDLKRLYVYVMNKAGKIASTELTLATNPAVRLDTVSPTIGTCELERTSDYAPLITGTTSVYMKITFTEAVSGIKTLTFSDKSAGETGYSALSSPKVYAGSAITGTLISTSFSGDTITFPTAITSQTILVTGIVLESVDGVKNVKVAMQDAVLNPEVTAFSSIALDNVRPAVTTFLIERTDGVTSTADVFTGTSDVFTTDAGKIKIHLKFTETASGLQKIVLSGVVYDTTASEHKIYLSDGTTEAIAPGPDYPVISGTTITFPTVSSMIGTTKELIIDGYTLSASEGLKTVGVSINDHANTTDIPSAATGNTTITLDSIKPVGTISNSMQVYSNGTYRFVNSTTADSGVSFSATDNPAGSESVSGMSKFLISTSGTVDWSTIIGSGEGYGPIGGRNVANTPYTYFSSSAARPLYVYFMDAAGNIQRCDLTGGNSVYLDNKAPTSPVIAQGSENAYGIYTDYYKKDATNFFSVSGSILVTPTADDTDGSNTVSGVKGFGTIPGVTPATIVNLPKTFTGSSTLYAVDYAANVSTGRSVIVTQDNLGPTATCTVTKTVGASYIPVYNADGKAYTDGVCVTFVPTDAGVGGLRWALSASTSTPVTDSTEWQPWGTSTTQVEFTGLIQPAGSVISLYLQDLLGNTTRYVLDDDCALSTLVTSTKYTWYLDTTAPQVGAITFSSTDGNGFTNTASPTLSLPFTEEGSGVSKIVLTGVTISGTTPVKQGSTVLSLSGYSTGSLTINLTTPITGTIANAATQQLNISGLTLAEGSNTVTVTLTDRLGRSTVSSIATAYPIVDTLDPALGTLAFSDTYGSSTVYLTSDSETVRIPFTEIGSGVQTILISGGSFKTSTAVYQEGTATMTPISSALDISGNTNGSTSITITTAIKSGTGGYILLTDVKPTENSTTGVTITLRDRVYTAAGGNSLYTATVDTITPTIDADPTFSGIAGSDPYFLNSTAETVSIPFTETGSGLRTITITNGTFIAGSTAVYTNSIPGTGGTNFVLKYSLPTGSNTSTITLPAAIKSNGGTVKYLVLTNVKLDEGATSVSFAINDNANKTATNVFTALVDTVIPSIPSALTFSDIFGSSPVYLNSAAETVSIPFAETGSGVKTITIANGTFVAGTEVYTNSTTGTGGANISLKYTVPAGPDASTITLPAAIISNGGTVTHLVLTNVKPTDAATSVTISLQDQSNAATVTKSYTATVDTTAPTVTAASTVLSDKDSLSTDYTSGIVKLTLKANEAVSGISKIVLTGLDGTSGFDGLASGTSIIITHGITTIHPTFTTDAATGTITITSAPPASTAEMTIVIDGLTLPAGDGTQTVSVTLTDAANKTGGSTGSASITEDATNPAQTVTGTSLSDFTYPASTGYTKGKVNLSFTATEKGSGISKIILTGLLATTGLGDLTSESSITVTGASAVTPAFSASMSGTTGTITFDTPQKYTSDMTIEIVGLLLPATDGTQTVGVKLTDAVLRSSTSSSDTIIEDTTAPAVTVSTTSLTDTANTSLTGFTTGTVNLNMTATELNSGISKIVLTGLLDSTGLDGLTGTAITVTGLSATTPSFTKSMSGTTGTIIFDTPQRYTLGMSISIVGLVLPTGDGAKSVGVTLVDALNNSDSGSSGTDSITVDATVPTVTVSSTALSDKDTSSTSYTSGTVKLTMTANENGSGLSKIVLTGLALDASSLNSSSIMIGTTSLSLTTDFMVTTDAGTGTGTITFNSPQTVASKTIVISGIKVLSDVDESKTVGVTLKDLVNNYDGNSAGSDSITVDTTSPTVTTSATSLSDATTASTGFTTGTVNLSFTANETGSGVSTIVLTGLALSSSSLSSSTLAIDGTTLASPADFTASTVAATGVGTITFTTPQTVSSKTIAITNLILPTGDGTQTVGVKLTDAVNKFSSNNDAITEDATAPSVTSVTVGTGGYAGASPDIVVQYTEAGSGVNKITLSCTGVTMNAASVNAYYSAAGTTYVATNIVSGISGNVITLSSAQTTGYIKLTGITLTAGTPPNTISALLTDTVTNASTATASTGFTLTATGPTLNAALADANLTGTKAYGASNYISGGATLAFAPKNDVVTYTSNTSGFYVITTTNSLPAGSDWINTYTTLATGIGSVSAAAIPVLSGQSEIYLYLKDSIGNVTCVPYYLASADHSTLWYTDTTAPSATVATLVMSASTAGSYYNGSGVCYYRNSLISPTATSVVLTPSGVGTGITESESGIKGYRTTSGTGTPTSTVSYLLPATGAKLYIVDNCGNESAAIDLTFTLDNTPPVISTSLVNTYAGAAAYDFPTGTSFTSGTASDSGSGMNLTASVISYYYDGTYDATDIFIPSGVTFNTPNATLAYDRSDGKVTTISQPTFKDWFKLVFTDNVGNTRTWYIRRQPVSSKWRVWEHSNVTPSYISRGTTFIKQTSGDDTTFEIERPALTNAYYATGEELVKWNPQEEMRKADIIVKDDGVAKGAQITKPLVTSTAPVSVSTAPVSISSLHSLALERARSKLGLTGSAVTGSQTSATTASVLDSKVETREKLDILSGKTAAVLAPLAEQYLAAHGLSPITPMVGPDNTVSKIDTQRQSRTWFTNAAWSVGPGLAIETTRLPFFPPRRKTEL